jgi:pimeloyl-ACP methyl ester carboxylesterase
MSPRLLHGPLTTPDGWCLHLRRLAPEDARPGGPARQPLLIVHGYGMNGSIFSWHHGGPSLMEHLLDHGFDPWSVDLRGTSSSRRARGRAPVELATQAFVDVPAAVDHVRRVTGRDDLVLVGCSLGGALLYAAIGAGLVAPARLITMGSPLVWGEATPLLRLFGALGGLVGRLPVRGTRAAAQLALPVVRDHAPDLLGFYLNPRLTDLAEPGPMVATVEDPHPAITVALARWIRHGHLVLDGHHVSQALRAVTTPTLIVHAREDGIVPPSAARAARDWLGGPVDELAVHHPDQPVRHVELFLGSHVHDAVFRPLTDWLAAPIA